jgi:hypothetical protein
MSWCGYCSSSLADSDSFCQNCGRPAPLRNGSASMPGYTPVEAVLPAPAMSAASAQMWPGTDSAGLPSAPAGRVPAARAAAAVGQATPNATYVGMRLRYEPEPEPSFDPLLSPRFILQELQRAALYWMIWWLGAFIGVIVLVLFSLVHAGSVGVVLFGLAAGIVGLTLAICFWFLKIPVQLSEWKFSVDRRADAAPVVFNHIAEVLKQRRTPLDSLLVRNLNLPGMAGTRDYLELRSGIFYGYVACFPFGDDLFVGWTFWVQISPIRHLIMFIVRMWENITGKGNDLYQSLRYDDARAMREAMHSAAREGIDVATTRIR